jgi:hypothetical protein
MPLVCIFSDPVRINYTWVEHQCGLSYQRVILKSIHVLVSNYLINLNSKLILERASSKLPKVKSISSQRV